MRHHTKNKGDIGVGYVIADLMSKNIQVAIPISEHQAYDLIGIRENGETLKISVKYRKLGKKGTVDLQLRSCYSDSNGAHVKKTDKNAINLVAIYCPDTNLVYYVNPNEFKETITLRINLPKNNQNKGIYLASNYLVP